MIKERGIPVGKLLLLLTLLSISLFANKAEKLFWDEVKSTNDIEMLKLYKKKYPSGIFESLADLKIERLKKAEKPKRDIDGIPIWLKDAKDYYRFFGIGRANLHSKGKHYQENQARRRAKIELINKFTNTGLSNEKMFDYIEKMQSDKYIDNRGRIYILLYIDNDDL